MDIMNCLAVDDEPHALELLATFVDRVPFLNMVQTTTSPWEGLKTLEEQNIHLMFLDIQMDVLSGLQMMEVGKIEAAVIITSAYTEYALDGFNYEVADYLLKPYSFDRFLKAVNKVRGQLSTPVSLTDQLIDAKPQKDQIFLKGDSKNKYHLVKFDDIKYIEGLKNYVQFYCVDEKIVTLQNMKDVAEQLPKNKFLRVHKSYIVNLDAVQKIDGHAIYIEGKVISIGPSYRKEFYKMIQNSRL